MRTTVLVLSIVGCVLSFTVLGCTAACFSGVSGMAEGFGDQTTAQASMDEGAKYAALGLVQSVLGLFGGIRGYRRWGSRKGTIGGVILIAAALLSIHNTFQFFTGGLLFAVAGLITLIASRNAAGAARHSTEGDGQQGAEGENGKPTPTVTTGGGRFADLTEAAKSGAVQGANHYRNHVTRQWNSGPKGKAVVLGEVASVLALLLILSWP